jgi:multiple sugar transport system ATP-binding protein
VAEVELKGIHKTYPGNVQAVTDFNQTIHDKEFVVLVGPSGCGKSTVLRMIAGLEEITKGELFINGKRMNDLPPKSRDIAMVFQNYALYPHMSVYDNMAFGLKLRKFPKKEIDERVREAAEILSLTEYLKRKPKALSGGQRQRVAVGRAIVRKPKVFLFDEPLSNLDAKMRVQMRAELCQLHARIQATMVYVTHDQVEAMTMGNRIVVMKDGVIQQADEPMKIYNKPANMFVAGFIGTPPMNFFQGEYDGGKVTIQKRTIEIEENLAKKLTDAKLSKVTIGIRPQDFRIARNDSETALEFTIELIELLGAEAYAHGQIGDSHLVAATDPILSLHIGDKVALSIRKDKVCAFHPQTGEAF